MKKQLSIAVIAAVATFGLTAPAQATVLHAEDAAACNITDGTLSWGVKESFRSYISGGIAQGEWQTSEGASYETPNFSFPATGGSSDAAAKTSAVNFGGRVTFTGHGGILNMQLANPTLRLDSAEKGTLLLDMKSNDTDGVEKVNVTQAEVGSVDLSSALSFEGDKLTITAAPVALSAAGVDAFGGFYTEGQALDPITVTSESGVCAGVALGLVAAPQQEEAAQEPAAEEPKDVQVTSASGQAEQVPWVPIAVGGVLIVGAAAAGTAFAIRKKKNS